MKSIHSPFTIYRKDQFVAAEMATIHSHAKNAQKDCAPCADLCFFKICGIPIIAVATKTSKGRAHSISIATLRCCFAEDESSKK